MSCTLAVHLPAWRPSRSWGRTSPAFARSWPPAALSSSWSSSTRSRTVAAVASRPEQGRSAELALAEGPSCIFVGPIETASKDMLEALYLQARDAYYSGRPLIVDDMFDKVELKLRCYGSKSVVKYPRCSLMRQSTYADAEEDLSQVFALGSIWTLFLAFGSLAVLVPAVYTAGLAYEELADSRLVFYSSSVLECLSNVNRILLIGLGSSIGIPIALASVRALERLWRNDLVALKGSCPNCGEEVFAFVNAERSGRPFHRTECHVCESTLEFRTKVEHSVSRLGGRWVYGRIYLVRQRTM
ncbi:PGR5-like protein 1B, chloroplastic [Nymphaea colorata]|nr:PGR5-like protein 1B, chloroplastic [Nymphaea colorata]